MFRVIETIRTGEIEKSRRVLPFGFAEREPAVEYILQLQLQFIYRGATSDHWWARNSDSHDLYRWEIIQQ
jgi:hypothetical protein